MRRRESVSNELEALAAIYGDDMLIEDKEDGSTNIRTTIREAISTAGDARSPVYLSFDLSITLPQEYPHTVLSFDINRCRGISEEHVVKIRTTLTEKLDELAVYDLIEACKHFLRDQQSLHITCGICLSEFSPSDSSSIFATKCGHYYHMPCFARYWHTAMDRAQQEARQANTSQWQRHEIQQPVCPICRASIDPSADDSKAILSATATEDNQRDSNPKSESLNLDAWRAHQAKMKDMYDRQARQGGIIDVSAMRAAQVIDEQTTIDLPSSSADTPESAVTLEVAPTVTHRTEATVIQPPKKKKPYKRKHHSHQLSRGQNSQKQDTNDGPKHKDL